MDDMVYTHISARVPDAPDRFLINAHGLLFDEIIASSLLTVDLDGRVVTRPAFEPEHEEYGLHPAGFVIHSAIYRARPDAMAVASLECGLLPLTQTATATAGTVSVLL